MNGFSLGGFAIVSIASLAALAVVQAVTFVIGRRVGRWAVVDVAWGPGFAVVAAVGLLVGNGDTARALLLFVLTSVWGLRLGLHIARESRGKGEDPRYEDMLERAGGGTTATVIRKIFLTQGAAQWFVSLPLQVSAAAGPTTGLGTVVAALGVAAWLVGFVFEAVGDLQLSRFKADPGNRGKIMDRGLWAWTRHPNYFGDAAVWWGLWAIAASAWPGVLTVVSPLVMTYFLVFATGARLLERSMEKRPGYRDYQQRTSFFVPLPPRRGE
ncbi:DUF1295 domain-containing protein [Rhodococcus rhodnii]|uniref:Uncharacterized protein n=2 Tax=Rhodococcus rhodnii TaxID=38312 RepID=R7WSH2_9NOCA|nr:DUF1295 domain-containing protein [Rhodococcus rhodnii]EOM76914.1 hypothetical protein Rrhod_1827 [Rhodococcus rhodnii LMG 5362]TXG89730.1 DUF1295 domain-containing protein [Rhodococcus rhodnii]